MKQILLLILLTASNDVLAQERIDTLYHYCPVKAGKSVFEIVET